MRCTEFVFLLQVCTLVQIDAWKLFSRGRQFGGNLGRPLNSQKLLQTEEVLEKWFTQKLDHFNPTDTRTWKQRYFVNDKHFDKSNGKVAFLMIGGEGEASKDWMTQGTWIDNAKRFGAICFQVEHRYYGKSHPTEDLSVSNLEYLTSEQALADLALFVSQIETELPSDIKWIAFGGSYSGSLAAWLRQKYPFLIHAAVSSSGPLLAEYDFQDYFKVVDDSLTSSNPSCVNQVKRAFSRVYKLLNQTTGQEMLNEKFRLCTSIQDSNDPKDIANFFDTLSGNFAGVVQYNKDNRIGANPKVTNITIDTLCDIMTSKQWPDPIDRLAAINNLLLDASDQNCTDYSYYKSINELRNVSNDVETGRQWIYQTCTEFAFFQSSSHVPQIFGHSFPASFYADQCVDIFGDAFDQDFIEKAVDETNIFYGGLDISVSNVVFVHGSIDPWHALGITKTKDQDAPAIFIEGTAHCADMYPPSDSDLPSLKAARVQVQRYLDNWIDTL